MWAISRRCRRDAALSFWLMLALLAGGGEALAQRNIGAATSIQREVSGALAGRNRSINTGDGVFSNENIRTGNESAAQLQFLDETKLAMGPSASVVLNRFIYNPDRTAREEAVEVTTGAARWVSGRSAPGAYRVRTPHATIGVRGTMFDLLVEARRTIVTLREGVIVVCPIGAPQRCITLNTPGQTVIVTVTTIEGPSPRGPSETRFADLCLRPIDRAACTVTTTAQLEPVPYLTGFYVGVHGGGVLTRPRSIPVSGTADVLDSIDLGNVPASLQPQGLGGLGGFQAGYSWQFGTAVFGLEADVSGLNAQAGSEFTSCGCTGVTVTTSAQQALQSLATVRGRAGIAIGDLLAFGTGGAAFGHVRLGGDIIPTPSGNPTYLGNRSLEQTGYVAGGGIEFPLVYPFLVRAEFLHYDLGKQTLILNETTGLAPGQFATMQFTTRGNLVRAGIDVAFAPAPQAFALASGADAPVYYKAPPPVFSWTGFYAGAHAGAGWARTDWFFDGFSLEPIPGPEGGHVATGGLAGGQIGYNYQDGKLVWGAEAQASWADLRGDNISLLFPAPKGDRNTTRVDALGTIAGRLGIAWDRTLLFGKAGGAWVNDKYRAIDLPTGGTVSTGDETRWGWMVGIGLERAFLDSWSVKFEYDYMGFGTKRVTLICSPVFCKGVPTPAPEDIGQNISVFKAAINYHFGGPILRSATP